MSDFTKELVAALKQHHAKVVHTMQIPNNCPTCALILRAEQTPVPSGRVIGEELYQKVLGDLYCCVHGPSEFADEFRTAPQATMPTQWYSREHVIGAWKNGWDYRGVSEDLMVPVETLIDEYLATITEGGKS